MLSITIEKAYAVWSSRFLVPSLLLGPNFFLGPRGKYKYVHNDCARTSWPYMPLKAAFSLACWLLTLRLSWESDTYNDCSPPLIHLFRFAVGSVTAHHNDGSNRDICLQCWIWICTIMVAAVHGLPMMLPCFMTAGLWWWGTLYTSQGVSQ